MSSRSTGGVLGGPRRNLALDLLRAVAVFLVLGRHLWAPGTDGPRWLRAVLLTWMRGGWVGVDLFFVLSGFLVAGLLFQDYQQHGAISVARFYVRRGLKIYPAFFFFLFVTFTVKVMMHEPPPLLSVVAEVCFLQSYLPGVWDHTWSLAVEEHFYIALPIVLVSLVRSARGADPFASLPRAFLGLSCLLLLLRVLNAWLVGYRHQTHLFPTHLRLDSLMMGVVLSYWYHFHREAFDQALGGVNRLCIIVGVALLCPAFLFELGTTVFTYTIGLTVFYLGSASILCGLLQTRLPQNRLTGVLAYVGSHSYSVYLWHLAVHDWGVPLIEKATGFPLPFLAKTAVYVLGSVAVGIGMASAIEFPVLRLRDRWFPSRTKPPVDAVPDESSRLSPRGSGLNSVSAQ